MKKNKSPRKCVQTGHNVSLEKDKTSAKQLQLRLLGTLLSLLLFSRLPLRPLLTSSPPLPWLLPLCIAPGFSLAVSCTGERDRRNTLWDQDTGPLVIQVKQVLASLSRHQMARQIFLRGGLLQRKVLTRARKWSK